MVASRFWILRGNRPFCLYWVSRLSSLFASSLPRVILPLDVLNRTGSQTLAAAVTTVSLFPILVVGLPSGVLADRYSRIDIMRKCEIASSVVICILGIVLAVNGTVAWPVYIGVAVVSTCAILFDAANFGLLPSLVKREEISRANSIVYGTSTAISLIAPAIGGLLYSNVGIVTVLLMSSVASIISYILLFTIHDSHQVVCTQKENSHFIADLVYGLRIIYKNPLLRILVTAGTASGIAGGALSASVVIIVSQTFGLDSDTFGFVISALGAGALCGSLILTALPHSIRQQHVALVCFPLSLVAFIWVALAQHFIIFIVGCFVWQVLYTILIINNITLRQLVLPDSLQGRVNTSARTIAWGGEPIGAAIMTALLSVLPIPASLLICSLPLAIVCLLIFPSPLRIKSLESVTIPETD